MSGKLTYKELKQKFKHLEKEAANRKRTEKALWESEKKFKAIAVSAKDAIIMMDNVGNISYWNHAAEKIFGYSAREALGKELHILLAPPSDHEASRKGISRFKTTGRGPAIGKTLELKAVKKDGTEFPIELSVSAVKIEETWHTTGIVRDITRRKKAEEELQNAHMQLEQRVEERTSELVRANKRLKQEIEDRKQAEEAIDRLARQNELILNSAGEGIFGLDLEGKAIFINPVAAEMFGWDPEELADQSLHDIIHHSRANGAAYSRKECPICAVFRDGCIRYGDDELFWRKDGTNFPVEYVGTPIREQGKIVGAVLTFKDITERKRAQEALCQSEERLRQSQKMEAIGRLAGGVAHDFNNLLTAILGYSDLLLIHLGDHDQLRRKVEEIKKTAERAASLTRQLLTFSRKQILQPCVLDLNAVTVNIDQLLRRLIGEDIELVTVLDPGIERVKADLGQIEQIIMNLAVNARDAMPAGGTLTIKTENVTMDKEKCEAIPYMRPGRFVCLSVEDTGVGMKKRIADRIFEPFFTTKELGEGTGLGLSTVYGIVRQHAGCITVYSEPGQGSTFKVYFPPFSMKYKTETKVKTSLEGPRGSGERILLVEDDKGVRELITTVLRENGYVVFPAANAQEAIDFFEKEHSEFHLVFSDIVLPDKTGLELVEELLSCSPVLRVLLSSGYTGKKSQRSITIKEKFQFLRKPYGSVNLLHAVKEALKQS